jgi:hypothetical protein
MDAKITLSFNEEVIIKAKRFADRNNISLSRLTEFLYNQLTDNSYADLESLPISDWVHQVAEGQVEYQTKSKKRKDLKSEYFSSKK